MAQPKLFVSYRRRDSHFAQRLVERIQERTGWDVFIDYEDIDETLFEKSILRNLRESNFVILIVTEHTFEPDRIHKAGDWIRREIREALDAKKEIVLVLEADQPFPLAENLPDDIREIAGHQGLRFLRESFDDGVERLLTFVGRVLDVEVPTPTEPTLLPKSLRRALPVIGAVIVVAAIALAVASGLGSPTAVTPSITETLPPTATRTPTEEPTPTSSPTSTSIPTPTPIPPMAALFLLPGSCDDASTLGADFQTAVEDLATEADTEITVALSDADAADADAALQVGARAGAGVVVWAACQGNRITYHIELPVVGDGAEGAVAEPESLRLALSQDPDLLPATIAAAAAAYYRGDVEPSAEWLAASEGEWAALDPVEQAGLHMLLGNAWLRHEEPSATLALEQYQVALDNLDTAAQDESAMAAQLHNNIGVAHAQDYMFEDAETALGQALRIDPNYVWARINRSAALVEVDRFDEAEEECAWVLQHRANFAPGYSCRAGVYYRQEEYEEALAAAQQAVQSDDTYALGHFYMGVASSQLGDLETAEESLRRALALTDEPMLTLRAELWLEEIAAEQGQ